MFLISGTWLLYWQMISAMFNCSQHKIECSDHSNNNVVCMTSMESMYVVTTIYMTYIPMHNLHFESSECRKLHI